MDELVWEEVTHRLQDPTLLLEAYNAHKAHRPATCESDEQGRKLEAQIRSANVELSRLLDAYQSGAIELAELQKRRRLVDSKLETLKREKQLYDESAANRKKEAEVRAGLEEFAALVSHNLEHISPANKQKLSRIVLDKIVVKDWRVDLHYRIPPAQACA